jgi:hypothetical protein
MGLVNRLLNAVQLVGRVVNLYGEPLGEIPLSLTLGRKAGMALPYSVGAQVPGRRRP